jgi:glycosyltransferase involved in cell wall biosynthesis
MKILYILPFVPWAVKVRSHNLIPRLARKHQISLVCVSSVAPSPKQIEALQTSCERVIHVPHSRLRGIAQCAAALPTRTPLRIAYCRSASAQEAVRRAHDETAPDVVYVERWRALQFVPEGIEAPVVCDPTDSMTLYNRRLKEAGAWWERLIAWEEYGKFLKYEGELAQRADVTLLCSQIDMDCIKEQAPHERYELVPNGVDCRKFSFKSEGEEEPDVLVFTGSFKYRPNCHAVGFFLENVFPLIRKVVPGARFVAVGNGASRKLASYRGHAAFEAVDFVPDLRPYLAKATVAVAPLTVGAGVSNKLAEGFAVGTPVVATPLACGDLPVKSGEHLLIGTDPEELAMHTVKLLQDQKLRRRIALKARGLVETLYDWEIVTRRLENVLQGVVATKTSERTKKSLRQGEDSFPVLATRVRS